MLAVCSTKTVLAVSCSFLTNTRNILHISTKDRIEKKKTFRRVKMNAWKRFYSSKTFLSDCEFDLFQMLITWMWWLFGVGELSE